jgi:hypothetical protein
MKKNNPQVSAIGGKRYVKDKKRRLGLVAKEDAHIAWLWRKVQGGMQIEFERNGKPTMSRRTLAKLISLQEQNK